MLELSRAKLEDFWLTERGRWRPGWRDSQRTATLSCPTCGQVASLSGHAIDEVGTVTPSVVCPRGNCEFHDFVLLVGWAD